MVGFLIVFILNEQKLILTIIDNLSSIANAIEMLLNIQCNSNIFNIDQIKYSQLNVVPTNELGVKAESGVVACSCNPSTQQLSRGIESSRTIQTIQQEPDSKTRKCVRIKQKSSKSHELTRERILSLPVLVIGTHSTTVFLYFLLPTRTFWNQHCISAFLLRSNKLAWKQKKKKHSYILSILLFPKTSISFLIHSCTAQ